MCLLFKVTKCCANFSLSHSPTLQWIRSAPCLFLVTGLGTVICFYCCLWLDLLCCATHGVGALSLIWKCKLVTRASAPLLRAVPPREHIWPVLHRPCWPLFRCWFTRAINMLRLASLERSSFPLSTDRMENLLVRQKWRIGWAEKVTLLDRKSVV